MRLQKMEGVMANRQNLLLSVVVTGAAAGAFFLDLWMPLGVLDATLYSATVLLSLWLPRQRDTIRHPPAGFDRGGSRGQGDPGRGNPTRTRRVDARRGRRALRSGYDKGGFGSERLSRADGPQRQRGLRLVQAAWCGDPGCASGLGHAGPGRSRDDRRAVPARPPSPHHRYEWLANVGSR